jgi:hypothetical protein
VVNAVEDGMKKNESRRGVWSGERNGESVHAVRQRRQAGLESQAARPATVSRLAPNQAATTVHYITGGCRDQLRLPFALGLKNWDLTPQKAAAASFRARP